jgi:hypothetical protein
MINTDGEFRNRKIEPKNFPRIFHYDEACFIIDRFTREICRPLPIAHKITHHPGAKDKGQVVLCLYDRKEPKVGTINLVDYKVYKTDLDMIKALKQLVVTQQKAIAKFKLGGG